MMSRFEGRTALVVGASRGIGAEIARGLSREGAAVAICARSTRPLEELAEELQAGGREAAPITCDVSDPAAIEAAAAEAATRLGAIDVLVYAAGTPGAVGPFEKLTDEDWIRANVVNVMGAVRFSRAVLPAMRERRWGRIVNIASTAAKYGSMYYSAYNASKHALLGLTRCLALETATDGITVNALCPGYVDTEMLREAAPGLADLVGVAPDEVLDTLVATKVPQRRLIKPSEVAELALYVASPGAASVTGQGLTIAAGSLLI
jgi:NAD(P)-dependent dehydrogenase (short-subunit alcohol dehydrogenase family)